MKVFLVRHGTSLQAYFLFKPGKNDSAIKVKKSSSSNAADEQIKGLTKTFFWQFLVNLKPQLRWEHREEWTTIEEKKGKMNLLKKWDFKGVIVTLHSDPAH